MNQRYAPNSFWRLRTVQSKILAKMTKWSIYKLQPGFWDFPYKTLTFIRTHIFVSDFKMLYLQKYETDFKSLDVLESRKCVCSSQKHLFCTILVFWTEKVISFKKLGFISRKHLVDISKNSTTACSIITNYEMKYQVLENALFTGFQSLC